MNPNHCGAIAEAAIALEAVKRDIPVLKPIFMDARYDLVFDLGTKLLRVQCKWARRRGNVVDVKARTCRRVAGGFERTTYSPDEVDAIGAYCPELNRCYLVPISIFPKGGCLYLRLEPSKNNQERGVKWAADYEFGAI